MVNMPLFTMVLYIPGGARQISEPSTVSSWMFYGSTFIIQESAIFHVGKATKSSASDDFERHPKKNNTGTTWNLKHLFVNGCFNWMIPNLYIGNGWFTKHPFKTGCLGCQAV